MGKKGIYFCTLAVLLPSLLLNFGKLLKGDKKKAKQILLTYLKACIHLTTLATAPALLYCVQFRLIGRCDTPAILFCYIIGITLAYLCEPVHRHQQYLGFVFPKAVELLLNILKTHGMLH